MDLLQLVVRPDLLDKFEYIWCCGPRRGLCGPIRSLGAATFSWTFLAALCKPRSRGSSRSSWRCQSREDLCFLCRCRSSRWSRLDLGLRIFRFRFLGLILGGYLHCCIIVTGRTIRVPPLVFSRVLSVVRIKASPMRVFPSPISSARIPPLRLDVGRVLGSL